MLDKFRFAHVSDTHFGLNSLGTDMPNGLNSRTMDGFQAFDELIDYAIKNNLKLIVHSGDVLNTKVVNQSVVNNFYARIKRLSNANIPIYILQGNHDSSRVLENLNGLDLATTLQLPNVYVSRGNDDVLDLGFIQIASVSYWMTSEEIEQKISAMAVTIDWTRPAILVVHLQIQYADFPGSFKEDLPFTPLTILTAHPWTYIAAGHIHKQQQLNADPPAYYAGSLTRCTFAEEHDPKGFNIVTVNGTKATSIKQHEVNCLKMLTLKGSMSYIRDLINDASPSAFKDVIVRCIVDEAQEAIDEKYLKDKFQRAFKVVISKLPKPSILKPVRGGNLLSMGDALLHYFKDDPDKGALGVLFLELQLQNEKILER